jgi:flagellar biosynthesis protein FliQ
MDAALVVDWSREALRVAILLGGPALLAALAVGIIVGIGQTLTQMHEPVIGLVPRVLAVLLIMLIALPWLISVWVEFARTMIGGIPELLTASVESISRIA